VLLVDAVGQVCWLDDVFSVIVPELDRPHFLDGHDDCLSDALPDDRSCAASGGDFHYFDVLVFHIVKFDRDAQPLTEAKAAGDRSRKFQRHLSAASLSAALGHLACAFGKHCEPFVFTIPL
jgi:hypothetical protein